MAQTTTKLSEILFYLICFLLLVALAFNLVNLFKVNSISTNLRQSCTCTGGSCDLVPGNSDPYGLVKVMNYLILGLLLFATGLVVARNFLLG